MNGPLIHEMKNVQFPFGELNVSKVDSKKILIKKRINYKNQDEYLKIQEKLEKLKLISHQNTINLRSIEENDNRYIDLYYPYVPLALEDSFSENASLTVKLLHKQFIELAIYLAKQSILTSFNPSRCGMIINERKTLIKYFLPLNEIVITNNISTLERSVQLFNIQSMHYLDTLSQNALNNTHQNSSQPSFKRKSNISAGASLKARKGSQPETLYFNNSRKLSVNPFSRQMRKLSNLSKQLSEFSQMRKKRTKQSTRISAGSFWSLKTLIKPDYQRDLFRSYMSQTKVIKERVLKLKQRSFAAIKGFKEFKELMNQHRSLSVLIKIIRS